MVKRSTILGLINKDKKAYEIIFTHYVNRLAVWINLIVKDKQIAEDISMSIMIDLPNIVTERYIEPKVFESFLYKIGKNRALTYIERNKKEIEYDENINSEDNNKNKFTIEELKEILSEIDYKILIMKYVMGYKQIEIAKEINLTIDIIKKRMVKIKQIVKEYYVKNYM